MATAYSRFQSRTVEERLQQVDERLRLWRLRQQGSVSEFNYSFDSLSAKLDVPEDYLGHALKEEITIDQQSKKTMENGASNHQNVSTLPKSLSLIPKNPPAPIKMSAEEERFQPFVPDQETESDYVARITRDAAEKNKNVKMGSGEIGVSTQGLSRAMEENKDSKPNSSDLGFSTHKLAADFRNAGTLKSMKTASGEVSKPPTMFQALFRHMWPRFLHFLQAVSLHYPETVRKLHLALMGLQPSSLLNVFELQPQDLGM